jgi:hypothetical protein
MSPTGAVVEVATKEEVAAAAISSVDVGMDSIIHTRATPTTRNTAKYVAKRAIVLLNVGTASMKIL